MHTGVDLPKPSGTPIENVMYGTVTSVGYDASGYGNYAVVKNDKRQVLYAHMRSVVAVEGQVIEKGGRIGYVGSTGSSTGPHLHLEYYIEDGFNTNPAFYLEGATRIGEGTEIIGVAAEQLGNGGETYWGWYGFGSRVEWCATFVSWCAEQCGLISAGIVPKFSSCGVGIKWFKDNGIWQYGGGGYVPKVGDYIFFD